MGTLISIIIAAAIFYVLFMFILPLVTGVFHAILAFILVIALIVYLLSLIPGASARFPWNR